MKRALMNINTTISRKTAPQKALMGLLAGICIIAFQGCPNDDDCDNREYKAISTRVLDAIPYEDGQILHFKTNEPGTFNVIVDRIFEVFKPDIPEICNEYLEVNLTRVGTTQKFAEFINWGNGSIDSMIQISMWPIAGNGSGTTVQFVVKQNGEMEGIFAGTSTFHPSIQIDGQTYTNVIERSYPDASEAINVSRFFYNKDFGIIQLETKGGLVITRM